MGTVTTKAARSKKAKSAPLTEAEVTTRAAHWLAEGNLAAEKGQKARAEKYYEKSQYWHDRMNKMRGLL